MCVLVSKFDFVHLSVVVEKSSQLLESEWNDIVTFLRNLFTEVYEIIGVSRGCRTALFLFGRESRMVMSASHRLDLGKVLHYIDQLSFAANSSGTTWTLDDALKQARDDLQPFTAQRLIGRSIQGHAMILIKQSVVQGASLMKSRETLLSLVNEEVYTTVIGQYNQAYWGCSTLTIVRPIYLLADYLVSFDQ